MKRQEHAAFDSHRILLMNKLLICAYHLLLHRKRSERCQLLVVTDDQQSHSTVEVETALRPWDAWLQVIGSVEASSIDGPDRLRGLVGEGPSFVAVIVSDNKSEQTITAWAESIGSIAVTPFFPPMGTFDNDLVREVSFFDFEIGGKNEWDGAPVRYSANVLKQISAVHSADFYPAAFVAESLAAVGARPLRAMDIGCGPISLLRWGAIRGDISIVGVDPLLDMYAVVLARHRLDSLPKIRCDTELAIRAEEMGPLVPDGSIDIVFTQNALDHTQDPLGVVNLIGAKLRPGGRALIQVAEKEGTRQKWDQLHKTDIYYERGELVFRHQHTKSAPLLSRESGLRIEKQIPTKGDWISCVLVRS